MKNTNNAAALIDFLAALTIAADCVSLEEPRDLDFTDAVESVAFWFEGSEGSSQYQPDGRVLVRLSGPKQGCGHTGREEETCADCSW